MLFVASDHAGFELKKKILAELKGLVQTEDLGTDSADSCDYPVFAEKVARKVQQVSGSLGLLICGSGLGMSIAANKFKGIRAAAVSEVKSAKLAREHNDANILCLGARMISFDTAIECVNAFIQGKFDSGSPRHQKRIQQIADFEK